MRGRWGLMAVALTLAVGGCSGSAADKPTALPPVLASVTPLSVSASPSASASASASAVPVGVPSAAVPATPQGAAAFVRYFYGELNGAFQDGNDERIRALSDPVCGTCTILADAVRSGRRAERRILGVSFRPTAVEAAPESRGVDFVTVLGIVPARRIVENGIVRPLSGGRRFAHTVALVRRRNAWVVQGIRYEKTS